MFKDKKLLLVILIALVLSVIRAYVLLDPDFGWRLKTGELILNSGFPRKDPFSYTMIDYGFVDHAWSLDVFTALAFPFFGKIGLALVYSLIFLLAFKLQKIKNWFLFPLAFLVVFSYFGVRVQVFSWVFISLVFSLVLDEKKLGKYKPYLPLLFLVWANIHGSFMAGLVAVFISFAIQIYKKHRLFLENSAIFLACLLATLLNPYGIDLWGEVLITATDGALRWRIFEWVPIIFDFRPAFIAYTTLVVVFVWRYREKISLTKIVVAAFFLVQATLSNRHIPFWVFASLLTLDETVDYLKKEIQSAPRDRIKIVRRIIFVCFLLIAVFQLTSDYTDVNHMSEPRYYPEDAVVWIKNNPGEGNIFNYYGWGGYLIWNLPEYKYFIDGRMPSWRDKNGVSVMDQYLAVISANGNYEEYFEKYNIKTIIIPGEKQELIIGLEKGGWHKTYEDEISVIYRI